MRLRITTQVKKGKKQGVTLAQLNKTLKSTMTSGFRIGTTRLAKQTVNRMGMIIDGSRKRPKGYSGESNLVRILRESIDVNDTGSGVRVSFLDKKKLDNEAPYWRLLNYGGIHPAKGIAVPGFFGSGNRPERGGAGETFYYGRNNFVMVPQKPIEGIRYLNAGIGWLNTQWGKFSRKFNKTVKATLKQKTAAKQMFGMK